jgi:hypothetical protein
MAHIPGEDRADPESPLQEQKIRLPERSPAKAARKKQTMKKSAQRHKIKTVFYFCKTINNKPKR